MTLALLWNSPIRRTIGYGLIALGLSVLCAPAALAQRITVEFDHTVDFTKFKTFAIHEGRLTSRNPALNSELMRKRLDAAIERALTAKGLTKASADSDLELVYSLGSMRRMEPETYPAGWRGTRVVRVPNTEGNLVIDLRDVTTHSLVWRGIATEEQPNPSKLAEKLDDMVKKAVAKYPPKE